MKGAAQLYVQDIRKGSIIVELVPIIQPLIANMDNALIVDGFVRRFGDKLKNYAQGIRDSSASKSDIRDLMGAVTVIANDPEGKSIISSVEFSKTKATTKFKVEFDTEGAKKAKETLQLQKAALELPAYEIFENKLMVFVRTSIRSSATGKKTELQAIIEAIHPKPLPITFETDLARERIEGEIREDEKNVYKKGFFVDCYTERLALKAVVAAKPKSKPAAKPAPAPVAPKDPQKERAGGSGSVEEIQKQRNSDATKTEVENQKKRN